MALVKVPKTPKRAFDTSRTPSKLLKDQVMHLEWAVRPASERKPGDFRPRAPRTEGEAAARIAKLTGRLLEQRKPGAAPPVAASPVAPTPKTKRASKASRLAGARRPVRKKATPRRRKQR